MINSKKWQKITETDIQTVSESDGSLTCIETNKVVPFEIRRIFLIHSVPSASIIRGNHASENTDFFLYVIIGSVTVELFDGNKAFVYILNSLNQGIFVPRMTWIKIYGFGADTIVQVCASLEYKSCKYIDSYHEFLELNKKMNLKDGE